MKRALASLLLFSLLLCALAAWFSVGGQGGNESPALPSGGQGEPSPCPEGMWQQLSRLAGVDIQRGEESEIPADLIWQRGADEPEIGDPRACKGGRVRLGNVGPFPANWLAFGSPVPQYFHYSLFTTVELPLVAVHPVTGREIPGLADAWAQQGRQLYFHLNPKARYSNGRPVRAADVALGLLLRSRVGAPEWGGFRAHAASLRVLGEHVLCLTLRQESRTPLLAARLSQFLWPAEPGFYAEAAGDYRERYRHRVPPTTGAYTVGRVERGRMVELVRVKDWWARDERYQRYRCNVDAIEHHFLMDEAQAWEFFLRGSLDVMQTRNLVSWQRYLEGAAAVEQGRIIPHTFEADYPMPPYGVAVNTQRVNNLELRRGLMQALDMDRVVALLFRGEGERLTTFSTGYGALTPQNTPTWRYNPAAARACFAAAGYRNTGDDGILCREDGTRLSLRFSYTPSEKLSTLVSVLVQGAAACGLELVPEAMPWQQWAAQLRERRHELSFWAGVAPAPLPDPARFFASGAEGEDAPFALQNAAMDAALASCEVALSEPERAAALAEVDRLVYEQAFWLPGWKENRVRLAAWSHLRFPDVPGCRFSTPAPYEVMEAHLYWVEPAVPDAPVPPVAP